MIEEDHIALILGALNEETHKKFVLKKRLVSKNGDKDSYPRRIFLVQDESKERAVLRISSRELYPKKDHDNPLFPKVFGYGKIPIPSDSNSTLELWYSAEEFIQRDTTFIWNLETIESFFMKYLSYHQERITISTREKLRHEIYITVNMFLKRHKLSRLSESYIIEAAEKYISSRKHISSRDMSLDLIEDNVLFDGKKFFMIDQEFIANSHTPIIGLFRFLYYHLAIYNHDGIAEQELTHEYAFMAMLLHHSQYAELIRTLNDTYYHEDEASFPFLLTLMYMHELLLQEDNGMQITEQLNSKADSLMHILLYKTAPKQFFLLLSQRKVGEGRKKVDIESELAYLRTSLRSIQSSKVYRLWQTFCKVREAIREYLGL